MFDLVIRGGQVVDGTGAAPATADVGVVDGRIAAVGRLEGPTRRQIDADGLVVTPGFVDIHTHVDGQATWDGVLAPSSLHGVTSVVAGNCGVGFAPADPGRHDWLIGLMEGVEDIPGSALAEGLTWEWTTFPEYLDALEARRRTVDVGVQVPHAALRAFVMGERGADPAVAPDDAELADMARLLAEALEAGAVGFSTSRTEVHRTSSGAPVGTLRASERELVTLAQTLRGTHGVLQLISDCYQSTDDEYVAGELALLGAMAAVSRRPLSFSVQQPASAPGRWRELQRWAVDGAGRGLDLWTQVAPRPIGLLLGLGATVHPFSGCPSYREVANLPLRERVHELGRPERRQRVVAEHRRFAEGLAGTGLAHQIFCRFDLMFAMDDPVDYDIAPDASIGARAAGGDAADAAYGALLEDGGRKLLYTPLFNFVDGDLAAVGEMLRCERALFGLSDAGAHCGAICDASFTTSFLTLWGRDREDRLPLEEVVARITRATARHVGWLDRGVLAPGMLADVNVLDLDELGCAPPRIVEDLPAGGRRLVQGSYGYVCTIKAGVPTFVGGEHTGELPGRVVRGACPAPAG